MGGNSIINEAELFFSECNNLTVPDGFVVGNNFTYGAALVFVPEYFIPDYFNLII